jgi:hypothetical protein
VSLQNAYAFLKGIDLVSEAVNTWHIWLNMLLYLNLRKTIIKKENYDT